MLNELVKTGYKKKTRVARGPGSKGKPLVVVTKVRIQDQEEVFQFYLKVDNLTLF